MPAAAKGERAHPVVKGDAVGLLPYLGLPARRIKGHHAGGGLVAAVAAAGDALLPVAVPAGVLVGVGVNLLNPQCLHGTTSEHGSFESLMPLFLRYCFTRVLFVILRCLQQAWNRPRPRHHRSYLRRKARAPVHPQSLPCAAPGRRKPGWVREELIHDAARYHDASCRTLAGLFNRRHAHSDGITIGKTFVSGVLRQHQQDIRLEHNALARRHPGPGAKNVVWAMDGTGKTDEAGKTHFLLGILDHGTRCCLRLRTLRDKSSVTILRSLLDTIERHGKPRAIRTDNEAIFTSRLFRFGLRLLGIRHQTIEPHCPWQNGRVERFFGTLKAKLDGLGFRDASHLDAALVQFRYWYNHVRPHQHLFGRTPAEVWNGIDVFRRSARLCLFYEAWGGRLKGELLVP